MLLTRSVEFAKIGTEPLGHSAAASAQDAEQEVMPRLQREVARRFGQRVQRLDGQYGGTLDQRG